MNKPRLTLIGLGRLGQSIGLALKKAGVTLEIVGHDKSREALQAAAKAGAVDRMAWNLYNAIKGAGLILLAMPLTGVLETIALLKDDVPPGVIVTDTASVKTPVLAAAKGFKPGVHFIGGHPIFRPKQGKGTGGESPSADLFVQSVYCLTPTPEVEQEALEVLTGYVSLLGAKPLFLDAAEHDGLTAGAEHLALLLSAVLLKTTTASSGWRELNKFAGDDYYYATELAARAPGSQRELMLAQRENLKHWIDQSIQALRELRLILTQGDAAALERWYETMLEARRQWLAGEVGELQPVPDLSEVRTGMLRMFLGGLATRGARDKNK